MIARIVAALYPHVKIFGAAAWASLFITFALGLLKVRFRARWIDMRLHYAFAVLTIALATIHALIVIGFEYV